MRLKETICISLSIGCFILWIMEFRRTGNFSEHYWLIMLCLAFLLGFQYVRYQRKNKAGDQPAVPMRDKPSTAPKSSGKKRRR